MTIEEIEFEMSINDVEAADIEKIIEACKISGFGLETLDEELQKRGYPKIFSVNLNDLDEDIEWDEFE